ncbi:MAG: hypothetical protein ABEH40_03340 [Haloferacaceae archaeon]
MLGAVLGVTLALYQVVTEPSSVLTAVGSILLLVMIGSVVGLVGSLPLAIGYNLLVVALGGGGNAGRT